MIHAITKYHNRLILEMSKMIHYREDLIEDIVNRRVDCNLFIHITKKAFSVAFVTFCYIKSVGAYVNSPYIVVWK